MKHLLVIPTLLLWLVSCRNDPFLDYELQSGKNILCISALVTNDSVGLLLSHNVDIDDPLINKSSQEYIILDTTAIINVFENGVFFDKLSFRKDTVYEGIWPTIKVHYYSNKKTTEGNTYTLEVNVKGYDKLTATAYLPVKVPIIGFDTTCYYISHSVFSGNYWHDTAILHTEVKATFLDPGSETNYYLLGIKNAKIEYSPFFDFDRYSENYDLRYLSKESFSDKYINGKLVDLHYYIEGSDNSATLCLYSVNEDYYKYYLSVIKYRKAWTDKFSEPVAIYSNVSSGWGIFVGYSTASLTIPTNK